MKQETALAAALKSAVSGMSKRKQTELITEHLYSKYDVFKHCKPLALGIEEKLYQEMLQYDPQLINRALSNHCRRLRYLKALAKGGKRFDLKGRPKGEISVEEQQSAHTFLNNKKPTGETAGIDSPAAADTATTEQA